ncbi:MULTISPECIES: ZIP family metal transporter [Methylobacillus]|uniref:Zinc/iron permease n=1 Tax=Methylobacillus flagellatus (strain ATCC 51484 / DSM 6875 / VKM B-1610 / KT) TaxID=265072 RepID=Q1H4C9_METFK|nr:MULTISPECIES: ZIP family metal transporter [Methylobacillus]ABE48658.1 zinc/iron permease [Methylobacillus flagellatus KT]MPS49315.1 ZIP family metal transporter [Methylobacillus sp.]
MNFPFIVAGHRQKLWVWMIVLAVLGFVLLMVQWLGDWGRAAWNMPQVHDALWGGSAAALATAAGTLPVLFWKQLPDRIMDTLFGFGAGVMLAASAFSLIVPGIEFAQSQGAGAWGAASIVGGSIIIGAALLLALERWVPHEHFIKGMERKNTLALKRTWLFVFAIALHNVPEGLAIGVGFAGGDVVRGGALATGIAIQDIPEGFVVAMALAVVGYSRRTAILIGMASGLVEPAGAVLGAAIVGSSVALLPWGLGVAAGAMLFVVSHEIIPESHRKGHEVFATSGLIIGFVLMMMLDTALG